MKTGFWYKNRAGMTSFLIACISLFSIRGMIGAAGGSTCGFSGSLLAVLIFILIWSCYRKLLLRTVRQGILVLFFWAFLVCEIMGYYVAGSGVQERHDFSYAFCLWTILFSLICSPVLNMYVHDGIKKIQSIKAAAKQVEKKRVQWVTFFLILLIVWFPIYLAFYPGIYCYDIPWQWKQYIEGSYATWHPIVHSFLFGFICDLVNAFFKTGNDYNLGLAVYSFLQMAALAASLAYALCFLYGLSVNRTVKRGLVLFCALFPVFPLLGISTTKDTLFSALFLFVMIQLINIVRNEKNDWKKTVVIVVSIGVMCQFRNNGIYAVLLLVIGCGIIFLCSKMASNRVSGSLLGILMLSFICSVGINALVMTISDASVDNEGEKLSIPGQQIARVYMYQYDKLTKEEISVIEKFYAPEALLAYHTDIADPVKNGLKYRYYKENQKEYYQCWLELGMKFPREYVVAFLLNTKGLWHIGDLSHSTIRSAYLELDFWKPLDEAHIVYEQSYLPGLKKMIRKQNENCLHQEIPIVSLLWSPALYNWTALAGVVMAIWRKRWKDVIPGILILGYVATLLLGPCVLPRYCLPVILSAPFYFGFVAAECMKAENRKEV